MLPVPWSDAGHRPLHPTDQTCQGQAHRGGSSPLSPSCLWALPGISSEVPCEVPMHVFRTTGAGGPEVLSLEERPDLTPGPSELLVRVRATALNRADLLQL